MALFLSDICFVIFDVDARIIFQMSGTRMVIAFGGYLMSMSREYRINWEIPSIDFLFMKFGIYCVIRNSR